MEYLLLFLKVNGPRLCGFVPEYLIEDGEQRRDPWKAYQAVKNVRGKNIKAATKDAIKTTLAPTYTHQDHGIIPPLTHRRYNLMCQGCADC